MKNLGYFYMFIGFILSFVILNYSNPETTLIMNILLHIVFVFLILYGYENTNKKLFS